LSSEAQALGYPFRPQGKERGGHTLARPKRPATSRPVPSRRRRDCDSSAATHIGGERRNRHKTSIVRFFGSAAATARSDKIALNSYMSSILIRPFDRHSDRVWSDDASGARGQTRFRLAYPGCSIRTRSAAVASRCSASPAVAMSISPAQSFEQSTRLNTARSQS